MPIEPINGIIERIYQFPSLKKRRRKDGTVRKEKSQDERKKENSRKVDIRA